MWLIMVFLLHTFGELCLSPIGLSMVTKLSPPKLISTMMGVWMGSFAAGNFVASQMKAISIKIESVFNIEVQVFWFIAIETAIAAIILMLLSPWLKKMMKGIK
jgi:proton-dependent oligopeptide transporter, POT family